MGGKIPLGFTIVETLIFLAISGIMLTTAFTFISGKQQTTEFNQGIHEVVSNLQLEISQVQEGSYLENNNDINCSQSSGSTQIRISPGAGAGQGASLGCQYIGEVFQFAPQDSSGQQQNGQYNIYPVASNQFDSTGAPVSSLTQVSPCALYEPNSGSACGSNPSSSDTVTNHVLPDAITIACVTTNLAPGCSSASPTGMMAYYTVAATGNITDCSGDQLGASGDINGLGSGGGGLAVDLIPFNSSVGLGVSTGTAVANINQSLCGSNSLYSPVTSYNQPVEMCLNSGTNNQSAIITLGGGNNPGGVDLAIKEVPCP